VTSSSDVAVLLEDVAEPEVAGLPAADMVVSPRTLDEAAVIMRYASEERIPCLVWGQGTRQDQGYEVEASMIVTTRRLTALVDWQAEDLTVVVEAGMSVADLNARLAEGNQTAVLSESAASGTVGGVIATASSSWPRYRYGPVRDRVLQTQLVTGDGRVVSAGGRVVKNVTGYDIPRLATGSFGALGLLGVICLKLWPRAAFNGSVQVDDPERAVATAYRPLAVIETATGCTVYLGGSEADVRAQADKLGGTLTPGISWPDSLPGSHEWAMRLSPALTAEGVSRCRRAGFLHLQAAHGVGEIRLAATEPDPDALRELRTWAESSGGTVVRIRGRLAGFDPWGTPPESLELQRAVKMAFDPAGISNPGRLPGRI
jgi:glycolate oxidase FAD binding subunit